MKADVSAPSGSSKTYPTKAIEPIMGANIAPDLKPVISALSKPERSPSSTLIAPPLNLIAGFVTSDSAMASASLPEFACALNAERSVCPSVAS